MNEIIRQVEQKYLEAFPGNPFDYYFLDDFFDKQYKDEQQFARIFGLFAVLAIVIACLGLWALASFTTAQKLKEIGIRKVLGASVSSIMSLLSWQFPKLVLIASIIALPLTWYGIDSWLGNFAFRIGLQWDLFVVPIIILIVLALQRIDRSVVHRDLGDAVAHRIPYAGHSRLLIAACAAEDTEPAASGSSISPSLSSTKGLFAESSEQKVDWSANPNWNDVLRNICYGRLMLSRKGAARLNENSLVRVITNPNAMVRRDGRLGALLNHSDIGGERLKKQHLLRVRPSATIRVNKAHSLWPDS